MYENIKLAGIFFVMEPFAPAVASLCITRGRGPRGAAKGSDPPSATETSAAW